MYETAPSAQHHDHVGRVLHERAQPLLAAAQVGLDRLLLALRVGEHPDHEAHARALEHREPVTLRLGNSSSRAERDRELAQRDPDDAEDRSPAARRANPSSSRWPATLNTKPIARSAPHPIAYVTRAIAAISTASLQRGALAERPSPTLDDASQPTATTPSSSQSGSSAITPNWRASTKSTHTGIGASCDGFSGARREAPRAGSPVGPRRPVVASLRRYCRHASLPRGGRSPEQSVRRVDATRCYRHDCRPP